MRIFIILTILTLLLLGCTVQAPQTQLPIAKTVLPTSQGEETKVFSAVTVTPISTDPNNDFHFGATPQMSQVGGLSGVFYRQGASDATCAQIYNVFRFYEDGLVMSVSVCDDDTSGDFNKSVWPDISPWFSRQEIDATTSQGIYYMVENKIWFSTVAEYPSHTVVSDYFGTFSKNQLTLDRFTHPNGYQIKEREAREEYVWLDVPNNP